MKRVTRAEILPLETYEKKRVGIRKQLIALKDKRRVILPPHLSLVFENRETVWYQVQEILRAERIVRARGVQAELDVYNDLVPAKGCLRATLFVEIPDLQHRPRELQQFLGLPTDRQLWLQIGGDRVDAEFDETQYNERQVAAVQYLTFRAGVRAAAALADSKIPAALHCAHPANPASVHLPRGLRKELASDLAPAARRR
jgi:hypothetical protein